jgi:hypothetical protein
MFGAIPLPSERHGQRFGPNLTKRLASPVGSGMAIPALTRNLSSGQKLSISRAYKHFGGKI